MAQVILSNLTYKATQFTTALWGSLQAHALMAEYLETDFIGHLSMAVVTSEHLLKHRVTPKQITYLSHRLDTYKIPGVTTDVDNLLKKANVTSERKRKRRG